MNIITRTTTKDGNRISLRTNDTYTLAFSDWSESTPQELAACLSVGSLRRLAAHRNASIANKAASALTLSTAGYIMGSGLPF